MGIRYRTRDEAIALGIPVGPEVKPGERGDCPSCGHWIDVPYGDKCWECQWTEIQYKLEKALQRRKERDALANI